MSNRYKLVASDTDPHHWHIEILVGPYKGLVYRYDKIKFDDSEDDPKCLFDFTIIDIPENLRNIEMDEDEMDDFLEHIGSILEEIINEDTNGGSNRKCSTGESDQ